MREDYFSTVSAVGFLCRRINEQFKKKNNHFGERNVSKLLKDSSHKKLKKILSHKTTIV